MKAFLSAVSVFFSILSISSPVVALPAEKRDDAHLLSAFTVRLSLFLFSQNMSIKGFRLISVKVAYGNSPSDEPKGTSMKEINGKSNDINHGFGGAYVWLVINHPDRWNGILPICDFSFYNMNCAGMYLIPFQRNYQDLAKGAGGNCRWLGFETTCQGVSGHADRAFLTDAALWRAPGDTTVPPAGWKFIGADLNGGRGGDYLYIVSR
ncbi:hypothetical protein MMC07_008178 [Pseudocyphellaria aurata]|nr:hypothetical protein [Pseudocyphellaria aurata]